MVNLSSFQCNQENTWQLTTHLVTKPFLTNLSKVPNLHDQKHLACEVCNTIVRQRLRYTYLQLSKHIQDKFGYKESENFKKHLLIIWA